MVCVYWCLREIGGVDPYNTYWGLVGNKGICYIGVI